MSRVFVKRDLPEFLARFEAQTNVLVQSGTVKGSEKLISIELDVRNTIALERIADYFNPPIATAHADETLSPIAAPYLPGMKERA